MIMSADSWTTCHVCVEKLEEQIDWIQERLGWLSDDEPWKTYKGLKDQQDELKQALDTVLAANSWIEYTEMYNDEGVLIISYSGSCSVCGASFKYENEVNMKG
jgi:beta-glucanase (GH16 family)